MEESTYELKPVRKIFSRIGLAFCAILVLATALQLLWVLIPTAIWGENNWATDSSWGLWIGTFVPLYCIAIPVGLLILKKLPAQPPQDKKWKFSAFLVVFPICVFLMLTGSLIGSMLSAALSGGTAENALDSYAMDQNPLKILVMVILAPILEEYICRKQIIDRIGQYGEKTAIFFSAMVFGLMHQNLFQFFYAFALGLVFGYIYTRTGRLRYTIILHSIVNFMGAVIAPWILSLVDMDAMVNLNPTLPAEQLAVVEYLVGLLVAGGYLLFYLLAAMAGFVLLIIFSFQLEFKETASPLPKGTAFKTAYLNVGMLLYILICTGVTVLALL